MDIQKIFDKYLGKSVEAEDPSNIYQCFDWAFQYCDELGIPRETIRHLYAYEIWTKPNDSTLQYFDYIPNTPNGQPVLGDIVVFGTGVGIAGHVSVCQKADLNSLTSTDQNWNGHKYVEYITHSYDNVLGWLRSRQLEKPTNLPLNDQTIIDLGSYGQMEIQAIRGKMGDLETAQQQVKNLQRDNQGLLVQAQDLARQLQETNQALKQASANPLNAPKTVSNPIAKVLYRLAIAIG